MGEKSIGNRGRVTLVGFGPGDPDLLTIKGYKSLEHADVIFYDDLTNESFLSQFESQWEAQMGGTTEETVSNKLHEEEQKRKRDEFLSSEF